MNKTLRELALLVPGSRIIGNDIEINGIENDSRKIKTQDLFVCMEGNHFDGHNFISQAIARGAVAILTTRENLKLSFKISIFVVPDMLKTLAVIVPYFYDYPARQMRVIGITGTNGKTTTSYLLRKIFREAGFLVGLIGTIQILIGDESFPIHNTTPNVIELHHILIEMRRQKIQTLIMEVSSHALAEGRVSGIEFDTAIFTNLTQDHLDFHKTMKNYIQTKTKLFDMVSRVGMKKNKSAIINLDDESSIEISEHSRCKKIFYSLKKPADLQASKISIGVEKTSFEVHGKFGTMHLDLNIIGAFNVYNVLAAIGGALVEKISPSIIKKALKDFQNVSGRFERITQNLPFNVIVDYAHTPDSIKNVLETARQFTQERIITVFGCGGDRDNQKRAIMGQIAIELSDIVIVTSDNPRSENSEKILDDIEIGIRNSIGSKIYERISDRRAAIFRAIEIVQKGDVVLILGKGHETYQILNDRIIHFDDREVAREAVKILRGV